MSDRLPIRTGNCSVPLPGQSDYELVNWEYTLSNLFSDAGYATAAFGKWHVGDKEGRLPTDQRFDQLVRYQEHLRRGCLHLVPPVRRVRLPIPKICEGVYLITGDRSRRLLSVTRPLLHAQIAARAVDFITEKAAASEPFFTYVCFTQMHPPLINHPYFTGKSKLQRLLRHPYMSSTI